MIRLIELFAGIGAQAKTLENLEIDFQSVAISEIDKFAIKSYELLHGPANNLGDVSLIDSQSVPDCDLLTYSFPCQSISIIGQQAGLDEGSHTKSSLLWECKKIIEAKRPKYLLMENVKNLIGKKHIDNFNKWLDYLSGLGYKNYWKVLNAVDYGAAQSRERLFCVSILGDEVFDFPKLRPRIAKLKDILSPENEIPSEMYVNKPFTLNTSAAESKNGLIQMGTLNDVKFRHSAVFYSPDGVCPTLTTMGGGGTHPKIYINGKVRRLTPKECWLVMGFSCEDFAKVEGKISNSQLYKQAGNSIVVSCLEAIFRQLFC